MTRVELQFDDLKEWVTYSIVQTMSQARRGVYDGNLAYIAELTYSCEDTAREKLQSLVGKGYITETKRPGKTTLYQAVPLQEILPPEKFDPPKNSTPTPRVEGRGTPRISPTPLLKDIIENISVKSTHAQGEGEEKEKEQEQTKPEQPTFEEWWQAYGLTKWGGEKDFCLRKWLLMTLTQRLQLMAHTKAFAPFNLQKGGMARHPKWYMEDNDWMNDLTTIPTYQAPELQSLTGFEQEYNWKNDIPMVQVKNGDKFAIVTLETAQALNLQILKNWKRIN